MKKLLCLLAALVLVGCGSNPMIVASKQVMEAPAAD